MSAAELAALEAAVDQAYGWVAAWTAAHQLTFAKKRAAVDEWTKLGEVWLTPEARATAMMQQLQNREWRSYSHCEFARGRLFEAVAAWQRAKRAARSAA